jgi:hypothetical protein
VHRFPLVQCKYKTLILIPQIFFAFF